MKDYDKKPIEQIGKPAQWVAPRIFQPQDSKRQAHLAVKALFALADMHRLGHYCKNGIFGRGLAHAARNRHNFWVVLAQHGPRLPTQKRYHHFLEYFTHGGILPYRSLTCPEGYCSS